MEAHLDRRVHTYNEIRVRATVEACLRAAADVERWPDILPHYRRVRFRRRDRFGTGRVEMEAIRYFGRFPWPVRWVSEMVTSETGATVTYRHVEGATCGMDVQWRLVERDWGTRITIVHDWNGPPWPVAGELVARRIIGPRFVRVVAQRTLQGIKREVERS